MRPFIHYLYNEYCKILERLHAIHGQLQHRNSIFFQSLDIEIRNTESFFQKHGLTSQSAKTNTLVSNLATLRNGFNPYTYTLLDKNQRDAKYVIGLQILHTFQDLLLIEISKHEQSLEVANEMVGNLLLSYLQRAPANLTINATDAEILWRKMGEDEQFALFQKKILLSIHREDAIILLDKAINKLAEPEKQYDVTIDA